MVSVGIPSSEILSPDSVPDNYSDGPENSGLRVNKRGKILRIGTQGPGLLMVDGQQYAFAAGESWKGAEPPKPGMEVEVEWDGVGRIVAIRTVRRPALGRVESAKPRSEWVFGSGLRDITDVAAMSLLLVGWFFLPGIETETPLGKSEFSCWRILAGLDARNWSQGLTHGPHGMQAGWCGLLALAAIVGPFLSRAWRNKYAAAAGLIPLLLVGMIAIALHRAQSSAGGENEVAAGWGLYLAALASFYFALVAVRRLWGAKKSSQQEIRKTRRAAA